MEGVFFKFATLSRKAELIFHYVIYSCEKLLQKGFVIIKSYCKLVLLL